MTAGSRSGRSATGLIAAATLGVYVLVMAGATTAVTDATAACTTWPTCDGRLLVPLDEPDLVIAWGHRAIALLVGVLVAAAGIAGWLQADRRRVRAALTVAVAGYPVQVVLGAATAVAGPTVALSSLHLAIGMAIFAALVLALAWHLEPVGREASVARSSGERSRPTPRQPGAPPADGVLTTVRAYVGLMKPRLMWLLCLVAAAGMGLAAGPDLSARTAAATLLGGVLAIGASGTFNHVLERDIDRRMARTADRPLATDRIGPRRAVAFGVVLTAASIGVFLSLNPLAAALGLAAILYYSVVYTLLLKPNTVQNTVVGGLAGAFPALIGAAAATRTVGPAALVLAGVIFLWTPAHFYNLALAYKRDYARGGFPMLPVVRGEATARTHVLYYLGATFLAATALAAVGGLGPVYAVTGVVFGAAFLALVVAGHRNPTQASALRSFHASNAYLGALLVAVVLDTLVV